MTGMNGPGGGATVDYVSHHLRVFILNLAEYEGRVGRQVCLAEERATSTPSRGFLSVLSRGMTIHFEHGLHIGIDDITEQSTLFAVTNGIVAWLRLNVHIL